MQLNPQYFVLQDEVRTERHENLALVLEGARFEALLGFLREEESTLCTLAPPGRPVVSIRQAFLQAQLLAHKVRTLLRVFLVRLEATDPQIRQRVELLLAFEIRGMERAIHRGPSSGFVGVNNPQPVHGPGVEVVADADVLERLRDLPLKFSDLHHPLAALLAPAAPRTMVVDVAVALAVQLVLGGDRATTLATADEPGVGEGVLLEVRPVGAAQDLLNAIELVLRHQGLVLPREGSFLPDDETVVEGVREQLVERAPGHGSVANPLELAGAESPLLVEHGEDLRGRSACEDLVGNFPYKPESVWIHDDRPVHVLVEVSHGRQAWQPAELELGSVAAPNVVGQVVDVLLRHPELELHPKLIVAGIHEGALRRHDL